MQNSLVTFLKQTITVIENIGEQKFLQKFNEINQELNIVPRESLLAATFVAEKYNIEIDVLLKNLGENSRLFSVPKNIFIYITAKYDRNFLKTCRYNKHRVFRAKKEINELIPTNSVHKKILEDIEQIETKIKTELNS